MAYSIKRTDSTNINKPVIIVEDQTLEQDSTSLTFVGKNYSGYSVPVAENFLHLLENFAKNTSPDNPIEGQLWYDNSPGEKILKVFDGVSQWAPTSNIRKVSDLSLVASAAPGDLCVDIGRQQLFVYSGSNWLLVGPQLSFGKKNGPNIETITDTVNNTHDVISFYSEDNLMCIISDDSFTPRSAMQGFTKIDRGITLKDDNVAGIKLWGTASRADALNINNVAINASKFLRSDSINTLTSQLNVRAVEGINVGSDMGFNITVDPASNNSLLNSKVNGRSLDIKVYASTVPVIHVGADLRVGINKSNPTEALDVNGNVIVNGALTIKNGNLSSNSGCFFEKASTFNNEVTINKSLLLNNIINGSPKPISIIVPGTDNASNVYDIGSPTRKFRNVYADKFFGIFNGKFTGTIEGNISGSASKLASATNFKIDGEVTSNTINFTGQNNNVVFDAELTASAISSKIEVTDLVPADQFLLFRSNLGLRRVSKDTLMKRLSIIPVGTIFPFAGAIIPGGYLLCDGSEILISEFSDLFTVIGYSYKSSVNLIGANTFALPDLRGSFALGRDDMNNSRVVPNKLNPGENINAGGGSANRVIDPTADNIGGTSGSEFKLINSSNLPNHTHNLGNGYTEYYSIGTDAAVIDPTSTANIAEQASANGVNGNSTTGGLSNNINQPIRIMNPYLTINYIIFTGVF